jgi:hypothetical protein
MRASEDARKPLRKTITEPRVNLGIRYATARSGYGIFPTAKSLAQNQYH